MDVSSHNSVLGCIINCTSVNTQPNTNSAFLKYTHLDWTILLLKQCTSKSLLCLLSSLWDLQYVTHVEKHEKCLHTRRTVHKFYSTEVMGSGDLFLQELSSNFPHECIMLPGKICGYITLLRHIAWRSQQNWDLYSLWIMMKSDSHLDVVKLSEHFRKNVYLLL